MVTKRERGWKTRNDYDGSCEEWKGELEKDGRREVGRGKWEKGGRREVGRGEGGREVGRRIWEKGGHHKGEPYGKLGRSKMMTKETKEASLVK